MHVGRINYDLTFKSKAINRRPPHANHPRAFPGWHTPSLMYDAAAHYKFQSPSDEHTAINFEFNQSKIDLFILSGDETIHIELIEWHLNGAAVGNQNISHGGWWGSSVSALAHWRAMAILLALCRRWSERVTDDERVWRQLNASSPYTALWKLIPRCDLTGQTLGRGDLCSVGYFWERGSTPLTLLSLLLKRIVKKPLGAAHWLGGFRQLPCLTTEKCNWLLHVIRPARFIKIGARRRLPAIRPAISPNFDKFMGKLSP